MLEKAIIVALTTISIHVMIYWRGMIFSFIADWFDRKKIKNNEPSSKKHNHRIELIEKPLFSCPICMTFWWGSGIYWVLWGNCVKEWLAVIFVAMGINGVIVWFKMPSK